MSILSSIIRELRAPDDQGDDWYGWASNQLSHAFLGVVIALFIPGRAIEVALIVSLLKECFDLMRNLSLRGAVDSLIDTMFWVIGAWLIVSDNRAPVVLSLFFALICGVVHRSVRSSISKRP